jgi:simple sugar transport system permease protein
LVAIGSAIISDGELVSMDVWSLFASGLFAAWLRATAPILLAALGGLVSERAGVINVGLEGLMLTAAFFGVLASAMLPTAYPHLAPWIYPWCGAAIGLFAAVAMALLLAVVHLEFGADLIVAGIGINMLAAGITVFTMAAVTGDKGSTAGLASGVLPSLHWPGLSRSGFLDALANGDGRSGHHVLIYVAIAAVPGVAWLLWRTRLGLRLRAIGENADAARSAGIPAKRLKYIALGISGLLAGLGGLYLSMGYLTLFQSDMTAGRGFLALAAIYLGARRPAGALAASLLFGAASVAAGQLGLLHIPTQIVYMVPPLATITAMALFGLARERSQRRALTSAGLELDPLRPTTRPSTSST